MRWLIYDQSKGTPKLLGDWPGPTAYDAYNNMRAEEGHRRPKAVPAHIVCKPADLQTADKKEE